MNKLVSALGLAGAVLGLRQMGKQAPISFQGSSVVITGGSRGLGLVLARQFAREGAHLTLLARDETELAQAKEELGNETLTVSCDVGNRQQVQDAIRQVIDRYGKIDVLINNAGVIQVAPLEHLELEDFSDAMAVHLWGPLYTTLTALPHLRQQGGGRIVNISSIGGRVAVPHLLPYSASKHALVGLSDGLRAELAKDKIYVTTVSPGLMRTGSHMNAFFKGRNEKEFTWFALGDSNPLLSISAERAAHQIIEACRIGKPELTITWQARFATLFNIIFPDATAVLTRFANNVILPKPTGNPEDSRLKTGWESQSSLAPSPLTTLADQATKENNEEIRRV